MRHFFAAAVFVLGSSLSAVPAAAFVAINGLRVEQTGPDSFYVPFGLLSADTAFWCAAGDYVKRGLGLPGRTPIYRMTEPPRKARSGLAFSLNPEGAATRTGVTIFGNSGPKNSVSATIAWNLCESRIPSMPGF